jgi:hypothetical protein
MIFQKLERNSIHLIKEAIKKELCIFQFEPKMKERIFSCASA